MYEVLVARPGGRHEMATVPEAIAATRVETDRRGSLPAWGKLNVRPLRRVLADANREGRAVHTGALFCANACKGEELPEGHPGRKYSARIGIPLWCR